MDILLSLHNYSDWGLLALRLAIAAIFLVHGRSKLGTWKQPAQGMNGMMRLLSICEPLGAIGLLLGLLTQPAAVGLGLIMIGAIYLKITKWNVPFFSHEKNGWEFDLILLAACISLFLSGAGAYSLDRFWLSL